MFTQCRQAVSLVAVFVIFTGGLFPALIWCGAQLLFPYQANGSLMRRADGTPLGSEIIGQTFTKPEYFHPRPSAAGSGYDASNSSGTNLGPTSKKLIDGVPDDPATAETDESFAGIQQLATQYRSENGLAPAAPIPADAATRSSSGLDPHISPLNAILQTPRVAHARGIPEQQVRAMVDLAVEDRFLGIFGEPRVNVLKLNLLLDKK